MRSDQFPRRPLSLLGSFALLACALAGIWLATGIFLPSAHFVQMHDPRLPAFFDFAGYLKAPCFAAVYPIGFVGLGLLVVALLPRGPVQLITVSRVALPWLAWLIAIIAIYFLSSAGVACKLAIGAQYSENSIYRHTLEQFALLEAAQGRLAKLREMRDIKVTEVRGISEFDETEARERVATLISALSQTNDPATRRRILATLAIFRERIAKNPYGARDVPRYAAEAGAPAAKSPEETLNWIAANLQKDGWEPVPLFKLSR